MNPFGSNASLGMENLKLVDCNIPYLPYRYYGISTQIPMNAFSIRKKIKFGHSSVSSMHGGYSFPYFPDPDCDLFYFLFFSSKLCISLPY